MPALYELKPWFTRRLSTIIQAAGRKNISPDVFTGVGVLGAVIAAIVMNINMNVFVQCLLVFIFGLVIRLGGANLDGAVARARGVSRPMGFVLNELGDRLSDFILFLGLYLALPDELSIYVLIAALASSVPTLVSVSSAAVGAPRFNGGPFGKTERCLTFSLFPLAFGSIAASSFILGIMFLGAIMTSLKRAKRMAKHLEENGTKWQDDQPTVVMLKDANDDPLVGAQE